MSLAASALAACGGRASFRPAVADCPAGTHEKSTATRVEDEGSSYVHHERWCERADGIRHGPYASWDDPGPSSQTGAFRDGKRSGQWVQHHWGQKTEEGTYVDDRKDGRWLAYHERDVMTDTTYRNGTLNGPTRSYCINGVVDEEGTYRDAERHGHWIWRYCNGRIKRTGWYRAGREIGEWTSYDETGNKLAVETKPAE